MPHGLEFVSCQLAHNLFLPTLTWTKKTVLEESRERMRQGEEGTLAGECPGEWYMHDVHENFLYEKGRICATWLRICHVGYNIYTDMDKEGRLSRRQRDKVRVAAEMPDEAEASRHLIDAMHTRRREQAVGQ